MCGKTQRQTNYSVALEKNNSNSDSSCGTSFFDEGIIGKESLMKNEEEINKVFQVSSSTSLNEISNDNQGVSSSTSNSISNKNKGATSSNLILGSHKGLTSGSTSISILNDEKGSLSGSLNSKSNHIKVLRSTRSNSITGLTSLTSSSKSHEKNSSTSASKSNSVTGNTESSLTISSPFTLNDNKSLTSGAGP
ncbi:unnamed protein product [Rotaria sp. Silwood1]|nr:unnamed protein product [Rotaria sp. Silwood1]CAF4792754.1 unnamed protein product [Rotaria sp. Silwood1]